jgi:hypothetical protein
MFVVSGVRGLIFHHSFADFCSLFFCLFQKEIEDYVHRIGRTGRCGRTGIATTFINRECVETTLLDLKHLLKEAKQKIPPVLETLEDVAQGSVGAQGIAGCGCKCQLLHEFLAWFVVVASSADRLCSCCSFVR